MMIKLLLQNSRFVTDGLTDHSDEVCKLPMETTIMMETTESDTNGTNNNSTQMVTETMNRLETTESATEAAALENILSFIILSFVLSF
jgi:hypothetical protein